MSIFETASTWNEAAMELESPFAAQSSFAGSTTLEAPLGEDFVRDPQARLGSVRRMTIDATVEGQKQGVFRGDPGRKPGVISGLRYSFGLSSPRDAASGLASGRRRYEPVTFWHEIGAASPQFFIALIGNEILKRVLLELGIVNAAGKVEPSFRIELGNARVVGLRHMTVDDRPAGQNGATSSVALVEEVGFSFAGITVMSVPGKVTGTDSWNAEP